MAQNVPGRHRAPGRFNPLTELSQIAKESAQPAVKGAAVVAASGGLLATFAQPASAAEGAPVNAAQGAPVASVPAVVGPAATSVKATSALNVIGFAAPKASTKADTKVIVIKDVVVEAERAKAKAAAKAERERAAAEAARQAEARAAATQRASRTATRTATTTSTTTSGTTTTTTAPKPSNPAPSASGIVGIAQSTFGIPYVYGGSSRSGFDCSGLTSWVYRQAGISIPRTASAQQSAATRVSSPRAGDLVFFGYPAYHVGIYVSPGRMIDAQRPGTVVGNHSIWTTPSGYGRF